MDHIRDYDGSDEEKKYDISWSILKITGLFDSLQKKYAGPGGENLKDWQVTMFFLIFLCTTICHAFSCIVSMVLMVGIAKYEVALFYFLIWLLFFIVTFGRVMNLKARVYTGLSVYYCVGLINLIQIGPSGSGKTWLFAFAIVTCLILGLKAGLWALVINALTFFITGVALKMGMIYWYYSPTIELHHWAISSITYFLITATILIPVSIIVNFREKRLMEEIRMTEKLRELNMQYKQEIVERKLIEKALTESEEKFSKAFKTSPAVMALISVSDGCVVEINDRFEDVFGYTSDNFIGQPVTNMNIWINDHDKNEFVATIRKQQSVKNVEISLLRKNGDVFQGLFSADQVVLKGKPYFLSILIDISDIKKSERELKQNNTYLGQVVGAQSKELNRAKFELDQTKAVASKLLRELEGYKNK
jgi:PAS domain S-box-containing protein